MQLIACEEKKTGNEVPRLSSHPPHKQGYIYNRSNRPDDVQPISVKEQIER